MIIENVSKHKNCLGCTFCELQQKCAQSNLGLHLHIIFFSRGEERFVFCLNSNFLGANLLECSFWNRTSSLARIFVWKTKYFLCYGFCVCSLIFGLYKGKLFYHSLFDRHTCSFFFFFCLCVYGK